MKSPLIPSVAMFFLAMACTPSFAISLPLIDTFESGLGNWTAGGNAGLYTYPGTGVNLASSGTGAGRMTDGTLTLTNPLLLDTEGYTSVLVEFDYKFLNQSSTRRMQLQYAADGVTFVTLGGNFLGLAGESTNPSVQQGSRTITEGPFAFTDLAKFRFNFFDSGGAPIVYVDNVRITGSPTFSAVVIPEPATATLALLALGGLLARRRHAVA